MYKACLKHKNRQQIHNPEAMLMMKLVVLLVTLSSVLLVGCTALAPAQQPKKAEVVAKNSRRGVLLSSVAAAAVLLATPSKASAADGSAFVGTYSDPINHPGGTRTIRLLDEGKIGDYQLAEVLGGGGIGEPKHFVLPAIVIGDRAIVIDFSPKGGPRDFTGVLNGQNIKFLKDGNTWPRLK
jgi:hypothetical protein